MIRYIKLVNGEEVKMTDDEIAVRRAEEKIWADNQPMEIWRQKIADTDQKIPRALEDVIDALPDDIRAKIAPETLTAYNAKKKLRSEEP